jgi:murein DD-endopeptidase MepM/ murein hydrolase activator NlpD
MPFKSRFRGAAFRRPYRTARPVKVSAVAFAALCAAASSLGIAEAAARVQALAIFTSAPPPAAAAAAPIRVQASFPTWQGVDLDGDGQADVADPTGREPRDVDAYGEGRFHAARDGGVRLHEGVDYVAKAGQVVDAPISGYVTKIGYAYPGDHVLRFVEIENPALHLQARVFYVDPDVSVGQAVAVGQPIGHAHSLQKKYPGGITDHIHLEIADRRGRKLDAATLILARTDDGRLAAD